MSAFRRIVKKTSAYALATLDAGVATLNVGIFCGLVGSVVGVAGFAAHEGYLSSKYGSAYTLHLNTPVVATQSHLLDTPLSTLNAQVEWFDYALAVKNTLFDTAKALSSSTQAQPPSSDLFQRLAIDRVSARQRSIDLTLLGRELRDTNAKLGYLTKPVVVESDISVRSFDHSNHAQHGKDVCRVVLNDKQIADTHAELLTQFNSHHLRKADVKKIVIQHELAHCFSSLSTVQNAGSFLLEELSYSRSLEGEQKEKLTRFIDEKLKTNSFYADQIGESFADTFAFVTAARESWFANAKTPVNQRADAWRNAVNHWRHWREQSTHKDDHFTVPALSVLSSFDPQWIASLTPQQTMQFSRSLTAHVLFDFMSSQTESKNTGDETILKNYASKTHLNRFKNDIVKSMKTQSNALVAGAETRTRHNVSP